MSGYKDDFKENEVVDKFFSDNEMEKILDKTVGGVYYAETPKFGILYHNKGGSTLIKNVFENKNNETLKINGEAIYSNSVGSNKLTPINDKQWSWATKLHKDRDVLNESLGDFEKITKGTSKKDLLIVIRNPKLKLLSGLLQDTNGHLQNHLQHSDDLFIKGYLFKNYPTLNRFGSWDELKELHPNIWEEVFEFQLFGYFKYYWNGVTDTRSAHGKLGFNEMYYKFLELNPINLDKLRIVDIDSTDGNLETVFKEYHKNLELPGWVHSNKGKYSDMVNLLRKVNQKYPELLKQVKVEISKDYFYYNLIKEKYGK